MFDEQIIGEENMQEIVAPNPYSNALARMITRTLYETINHENQISHQEQDRCFTSNDMRFRNFLPLFDDIKDNSGKTS